LVGAHSGLVVRWWVYIVVWLCVGGCTLWSGCALVGAHSGLAVRWWVYIVVWLCVGGCT
jgi:hypothetical protein